MATRRRTSRAAAAEGTLSVPAAETRGRRTRRRAAADAAAADAAQAAALPAAHTQANIFARTVPFVRECHSFGEFRKANLSAIETPTDKSLLVLTKRLVQMPETMAIANCDYKFKEWLDRNATPFRRGFWLIPLGMIERTAQRAQEWESERQGPLLDAACAAYPAQIELMRGPLGPQFNPTDYPSVGGFRSRFHVSWRFIDFGVPALLNTFKADIFQREREKLEAFGRQAEHTIEQHLATTLLGITEHVAELLTPRENGRKPQLRDGFFDPLFQFLDTLPLRDVTNFRELQAAAQRLRETATGVAVKDLRSDTDLRARTAAVITEVRDTLAGLVEMGAARGIRVREEDDAPSADAA